MNKILTHHLRFVNGKLNEFENFENSGFHSIIIPDSVTAIEEKAISGCNALESVQLPHNMKAIPEEMLGIAAVSGTHAFNCDEMKGTIIVPKNVKDKS